jgi:hypothetical protein
MTFEEELQALIARMQKSAFEDLRAAVDDLFRKHGREVPPPITGTMNIEEPPDTFGGH